MMECNRKKTAFGKKHQEDTDAPQHDAAGAGEDH